MSKLIPQTTLSNIPDLYETGGELNPKCHVKLFTPNSDWSWYIIEFSKEDRDACYGYVDGLEGELGYFSLRELEELFKTFALGVERDVCFKPTRLSKVKKMRTKE